MQTTITTTTKQASMAELKDRQDRSEPLTVPLGDLLKAAMEKKADGQGGGNFLKS